MRGADAIWLAGQGWPVTAVDFSTQALDRAAGHTPAHLAGRVTWQQADIRDWQPDERPSPIGSLPESPSTDIW